MCEHLFCLGQRARGGPPASCTGWNADPRQVALEPILVTFVWQARFLVLQVAMAIRNAFRLLGRLGSVALGPNVAEAAQHMAKPYLQTALRGVSLTTPAMCFIPALAR